MDDAPSVKRRLAAILAADIAGYSRLMGEDETEPAFGQFLEATRSFSAS
jgi:class 3 adenylate cyclase